MLRKAKPVDIEGDELFPRVNWAKADPLPRMLPIPEIFEYIDHLKNGHTNANPSIFQSPDCVSAYN